MLVAVSACAESDFPTGTFSAEDGYFKFEFMEDGKWNLQEGGAIRNMGTYSVQGNEFTWERDQGCDSLTGKSTKSTYTWTFKNRTLLFEVKGEDKCDRRFQGINSTPLYKE